MPHYRHILCLLLAVCLTTNNAIFGQDIPSETTPIEEFLNHYHSITNTCGQYHYDISQLSPTERQDVMRHVEDAIHCAETDSNIGIFHIPYYEIKWIQGQLLQDTDLQEAIFVYEDALVKGYAFEEDSASLNQYLPIRSMLYEALVLAFIQHGDTISAGDACIANFELYQQTHQDPALVCQLFWTMIRACEKDIITYYDMWKKILFLMTPYYEQHINRYPTSQNAFALYRLALRYFRYTDYEKALELANKSANLQMQLSNEIHPNVQELINRIHEKR